MRIQSEDYTAGISAGAKWTLAALGIAGFSVLLAVMVLLQTALGDIAKKSNELESRRSEQLVSAAVQGLLTRVGAMTTDNSAWDAAVAATYGPTIDTAWANANWGPGAQDAKPYDGIYLLNETGDVLWGVFQGKTFEGHSAAALGLGTAQLFSRKQVELDRGMGAQSALTRTSFGPAVVSIALVHPADGPFETLGKARRYVVLTRHLTPEIVASVGHALQLDDLHLASAGRGKSASLDLKSIDGAVVGRLAWSQGATGAEATGAGRTETMEIMALVGALVSLLMIVAALAVHKLAKSEGSAQKSSMTDALSQLPNRRALYQRLITAAHRVDGTAAVVFIDLDGFKLINDTYGHDIGDALICAIASRLSHCLLPGCMLARIGGDEFAMVSLGADSSVAARRFATDALGALAQPIRLAERVLKPGASLGVASANLKSITVHELLRRADVAMYHAKETGRGRIVEHSPALDEARLAQQSLEDGIRQGLEREEFDVVYQPVVSANTHDVTGVEALVRWPGRPAGPLFPDAFIPVAERSGLIQELGLFVLERACRDLAGRTNLQLSVNISPVQFRDADFEFRVLDILSRTGFAPNRLELELTEGHLVESPDRAVKVMTALRAIGVKFSLDDFGTGYSSIGYLKQFEFDRIKIDRSLASIVDRDPQAGALVSGTVYIAKALCMAITAEGVENDDLARLLRLAGCTSLQGYYFGKPGQLTALELQPAAQRRVIL